MQVRRGAPGDDVPLAIMAWVAGTFTIVAAIADWEWFFSHPKARFFVDRFGRSGARVFYVILGLMLVVLGFVCRNVI